MINIDTMHTDTLNTERMVIEGLVAKDSNRSFGLELIRENLSAEDQIVYDNFLSVIFDVSFNEIEADEFVTIERFTSKEISLDTKKITLSRLGETKQGYVQDFKNLLIAAATK